MYKISVTFVVYRLAEFGVPKLKIKISADADRARKHGMEEYIAADPITMDHHDLFQELQRLSLDWRLEDPFASLVNYLLYILTRVWVLRTLNAV